jgi:hypothetical protein
VANELDEEGDEEAGHDNGRGGTFVRKLSQAFIAEHELRMGVQVNEGSGNDYSGAELFEDEEDLGELGGPTALKQNGREDSKGTCR